MEDSLECDKVLSSAAEIPCRGRQDFHFGHDGGYLIPIQSKIGQGMRIHIGKLVNWYGKNELIPVHLENNISNSYLNREVKSTETNNVNDADHYLAKNCQQSGNGDGREVRSVSPTKFLNRDAAPFGDDIEPIGEARADVEVGNEEDEEPLEAEIPRERMNPKNPTSREKQEHEDTGHAVYRSWCAACVEGRGVGGQHRIELLEEEEREKTTPIAAFGYGFLTQENADTFPILTCRDSRYGQTGATCCERKGPTAYSISLLVGFIKDLGFRRIILKCDNEPSTKALQDAVIHACVGVEVIPQGPPKGDHMANGRVEMAMREVKRQCRTVRISAEHNTGVRIADYSPLLSWLPRFAAQVMNKMRIGNKAKKSELRRTD